MERTDIHGWGADASPENRPGVPMEWTPHPAEGAHWTTPDRQQPSVPIFIRRGLDKPTPVFGTAQPPTGLSGQIRRLAYQVPEHTVRHWMTLLLADRVDVLEHRFSRGLIGFAVVPAVGIAAGAWLLLRPRKRRARLRAARCC